MIRPTAFPHRNGLSVPLVLAILLLLGGMTVYLVQANVIQFRQARTQSRQLQHYWLLRSGYEKAMQSAADSPDYKGEDWLLPNELQPEGKSYSLKMKLVQKQSEAPTVLEIQLLDTATTPQQLIQTETFPWETDNDQ